MKVLFKKFLFIAAFAVLFTPAVSADLSINAGVESSTGEKIKIQQLSERLIRVDLNDKTLNNKNTLIEKLEFYRYFGESSAVKYPIAEIVSLEDGVAVILSAVTLKNGKEYLFCYGEKEGKFTAHVGDPVSFEISDNSDDLTIDNDVKLTLTYYDEKGVDVTQSTNMKIESGQMMLSANQLDNNVSAALSVESLYPVVSMYEFGTCEVEVTLYTEVDEYGNPLKPIVKKHEITLEERPEYEIAGCSWYTLDPKSYNGYYSGKQTHSTYVGVDSNVNGEKILVLLNNRYSKDPILTSESMFGEFTFESTNPEVLYVAYDGRYYAYSAGSVQVIVYFTPYDREVEEPEIVAVVSVRVLPEKKVNVNKSTLSATALTLGYCEEDFPADPYDHNGATGIVELSIKDQYGEAGCLRGNGYTLYAEAFKGANVVLRRKSDSNAVEPTVSVVYDTMGAAIIKFTLQKGSVAEGQNTASFIYDLDLGTGKKTVTINAKRLDKYNASTGKYELIKPVVKPVWKYNYASEIKAVLTLDTYVNGVRCERYSGIIPKKYTDSDSMVEGE
ncbi:MAG: hypothetical protein K6B75_08340, partial [Lachnospiraceae bacterium]|nr:hypothetical protein [Lachnospiraceae bacterium]